MSDIACQVRDTTLDMVGYSFIRRSNCSVPGLLGNEFQEHFLTGSSGPDESLYQIVPIICLLPKKKRTEAWRWICFITEADFSMWWGSNATSFSCVFRRERESPLAQGWLWGKHAKVLRAPHDFRQYGHRYSHHLSWMMCDSTSGLHYDSVAGSWYRDKSGLHDEIPFQGMVAKSYAYRSTVHYECWTKYGIEVVAKEIKCLTCAKVDPAQCGDLIYACTWIDGSPTCLRTTLEKSEIS